MGPPPATPAPSRFLASKRLNSHQVQGQTPDRQHAVGSNQFHATPRFSFASTPRPSATQPGPAFSTPALAIKTRVARTRSTQDIIDDSSPVNPAEDNSPAAHNGLPEPIELNSSLAPQSSPFEKVQEERSPKRRRISIGSPGPDTDPAISPPQQHSDIDIDDDSFHGDPDGRIASYHSDLDSPSEDPLDKAHHHTFSSSLPPSPLLERKHPSDHDRPPSSPPSEIPEDQYQDEHEARDGTEASEQAKSQGDDEPFPTPPTPHPPFQPKFGRHHSNTHFHPAPRFRPPDLYPDHAPADPTRPGAAAAARTDYHRLPPPPPPDLFSPQRRGGTAGRYLPGGLAAELREWLVDVKRGAADGEGERVRARPSGLESGAGVGAAAANGEVRVAVEEVRSGGAGMTLVSGFVVGLDGGADGREGVRVRVILAGEGNVEGLGGGKWAGGGKNGVMPGVVVGIAPPAWDVELDGRWAVAYRWDVVKGVGENG
ncbi:hypothetical protein VTK26DRAFT_7806 [Humicola hyalothermophila]